MEVWKYGSGIGPGERLTTDGKGAALERASLARQQVGRCTPIRTTSSGLAEIATKNQKKIATAKYGSNSGPAFSDIAWSPDSKWFAYATSAVTAWTNSFSTAAWIRAPSRAMTTDRYSIAGNPAWSSGKLALPV